MSVCVFKALKENTFKEQQQEYTQTGIRFQSPSVFCVRKGLVVSKNPTSEAEAHLGGYSIYPDETALYLSCLGSI